MKKTLLLTAVAGVALMAGAAYIGGGDAVSNNHAAYADDHDGGKGGKGPNAGGKGHGGAGGGDGGHHGGADGGGTDLEDRVFKGKKGGSDDHADSEDDGEDSDRPSWAGGGGKPGTGKKDTAGGDFYGDLWIILRDENGVPILNADGFVQPVDAEGNPLPLDEEGKPLDEDATLEVELGRLNVGRSPHSVLDGRLDEVITNLNTATALSLDPAGRLVLTIDGEEKTIDSPLENLAIYQALMTTGTLEGVTLSADILGDMDFLTDGALTQEDVDAATVFLGAASDKTGTFTVDEIVYLNTFIEIGGSIASDNGIDYFDFSSFDYDRSDAYEDATATILVKQDDGTYKEETVSIWTAVFDGEDYTSASGVDGFTQAADDARKVINFIHEYEIPSDDPESGH